MEGAHAGLKKPELFRMQQALLDNAQEGKAVLMSRKDTSFVGTSEALNSLANDEEVICAIKSVPTHY